MGILLLGLLIAVFGICCYVFLDILVFKQNANKKKQFIIYNLIASVLQYLQFLLAIYGYIGLYCCTHYLV